MGKLRHTFIKLSALGYSNTKNICKQFLKPNNMCPQLTHEDKTDDIERPISIVDHTYLPLLFRPQLIRELTIRNRIIVSPMCQYSCENNDGIVHDWHFVHLASRAVGGAGLIFTEASSVTPDGRISPQDAGFWSDAHADAWVRTIKFVKQQGAAIGIQLAHAGRKASTQRPWEGHNGVDDEHGGWTPVAPSAIPFSDTYRIPHEATIADINRIKEAFAEATDRANRYNFDVVELHAAHGYLLHEFMSPLSNKRKDQYGGSFENRIRLTLEIVELMREKWPKEKPFWVRISASDWVEGGWDIDQSVQLARELKKRGVDVIDTSSGGLHLSQKIKIGPGYQVPFSEKIKREANIMTCAVGLITEAEQAEQILEHEQADFVAMAREILRDPYFPLHAAKALGVTDAVRWPPQYERAK